ncbi:class I SAM-dependent methyltransferase [Nannocystis radixulma]|uniref:S-adenosyl-L-methionine-dependent methyltransferase n=1 Tax=Nannocystis radixulma TaxID=2995305 RepID=A0ABT5B824_9BACT|nr:SAM-dependent methyltransferase [Nannocystis radixulma]MDC0669805.1 SAM-dependent methyltransferase [Nannocystis radixulma]
MSARFSRTALLAAFARAAHAREPAFHGPDVLAERLLDGWMRVVLDVPLLRGVVRRIYERRMPGTFEFLAARTQFFDEVVREQLAAGARQVVILGAGFDTRAHRFAGLAARHGATFFEVDTPATQAEKRRRAARLGPAPPVRYLAVDLNRTSLADALRHGGFDFAARTVFLWEGVTFYLTGPAVDAVLRFVASSAGPASVIVFDFLFERAVTGSKPAYGLEQGRAFVASRGEPFTFGIDEARVDAFLAERGLRVLTCLLPEDMQRRWFARPDGHQGQVAGFYGMVLAGRAAD